MHFSSNLLFVATNPLVASSSLDTYFPVAEVVSSKLGNFNRIKLLFQLHQSYLGVILDCGGGQVVSVLVTLTIRVRILL